MLHVFPSVEFMNLPMIIFGSYNLVTSRATEATGLIRLIAGNLGG